MASTRRIAPASALIAQGRVASCHDAKNITPSCLIFAPQQTAGKGVAARCRAAPAAHGSMRRGKSLSEIKDCCRINQNMRDRLGNRSVAK